MTTIYLKQNGHLPTTYREDIPDSCAKDVIKQLCEDHLKHGWMVECDPQKGTLKITSHNPKQHGAEWFCSYMTTQEVIERDRAKRQRRVA